MGLTVIMLVVVMSCSFEGWVRINGSSYNCAPTVAGVPRALDEVLYFSAQNFEHLCSTLPTGLLHVPHFPLCLRRSEDDLTHKLADIVKHNA